MGGGPGARTEVTFYKRTEGKTRKIKLPIKITVALKEGDIIEIKTAGGGGYGNPGSRDRSRIRDDVENEIVSYSYAKRVHYRIPVDG